MAVDDAFTKVLLHLDGADASTTFTDESGKTWTGNNSAQIDTAEKKFGTGSLLLEDDNPDSIYTDDHADFTFGADDFTIDLRFKRGETGTNQCLIGKVNSSGNSDTVVFRMVIDAGDRLFADLYYDGTLNEISVNGISDTASWHHLALVRYSNIIKLYYDGTSVGTPLDATGFSTLDTDGELHIGKNGQNNNWYYDGWIDEVRISKGIARWVRNFAPPMTAYPYVPAGQVIFID